MMPANISNQAVSDTPVERKVRAPSHASFIAPDALMSIKNLQLRAKVVVDGFLAGLHRSPYHGFSSEFSEYRQYASGDDLRYLDWKLLARSDRYFIKRFEDETNLRCYLLVDLSRSMGYGSVGYTKADYAKTVAATLAYFLAMQRDATGLLTFGDRVLDYLPARYRPGHVHHLILSLERGLSGTDTHLEPPIEQMARTVKKRGLMVLLTDFLASIENLEKHLGYLRSNGHEVVVMRILDPTELNLDLPEAALMEDVESGRTMYVDPATARLQYREQFDWHAKQLTEACLHLGIDYHQYTTQQPVELALFDFVSNRQHQAQRTVRRRSGNRSSTREGATL